jgi:hypothetical protein
MPTILLLTRYEADPIQALTALAEESGRAADRIPDPGPRPTPHAARPRRRDGAAVAALMPEDAVVAGRGRLLHGRGFSPRRMRRRGMTGCRSPAARSAAASRWRPARRSARAGGGW